jgi:Zn-dependent protease with chaperone function
VKTFPALLGRNGGLLEIQRDAIVFTPDRAGDLPLTLSTRRLEISIEGQNSQHYYLKDPNQPESVLCVQDLGAIEALANFGQPAAQAILEKSKSLRMRRSLVVGSPFIVSLILLLALPFLLSLVPIGWLSTALTFEQEQKLGQFLFPLTKEELKVLKESKAQAGLEKLVAFVQASTPELQALKFEIYVSESTEINAFALPGGILVFNQGLLQKSNSVEEILGVLAHEMAHVEKRHSVKALAGRLGSLGGLIVLSSLIGSDAAIVIGQAGDMISLKHSRDDEAEADRRGFEFLQNAKASTDGMIRFFSKLQEQESGLPAALSFLSTHPLSSERVEALKRLPKRHADSEIRELPVTLQELAF